MSLRRWGNLGLGEAGKVEIIAGFLVCGGATGADLWRGGGGIFERVRLRALWSLSEV